jgi:hypothetical protein
MSIAQHSTVECGEPHVECVHAGNAEASNRLVASVWALTNRELGVGTHHEGRQCREHPGSQGRW